MLGPQAGLEFLTGYLIEKALSVDNIFVFVLIFAYFRVPPQYQHRVLFWGIIGALLMRAGMIFAGAYLIKQFHWIIYVFGAFPVFTGVRMATQKEHDIEPESNPMVRLVRRLVPVTGEYHGQRFFVREAVDGVVRLVATPLFVVLVLVLVFVGAKMVLADVYKVPSGISLGVIALILAASVGASVAFPKQAEEHDPVEHDPLRPLGDAGPERVA